MDTLDVLVAARAEVEKGWRQHYMEDELGNVCAMGGLRRVTGEAVATSTECLGWKALVVLLGVLPEGPWASVSKFNDNPKTTKADVLALFDRAIVAEAVSVSCDPAHVHAQAA